MTQPQPASQPQPTPPPGRVIVKNTTFRDAVVAGIAGVLVLVFIGYGVMSFKRDSDRASSSTVVGTIVEKQFNPAPQEEISVGRKGLRTKQIDGEYLMKVRVDGVAEPYEVPVTRATYESKSVGDSLTFIRPLSDAK